MDMIPPYSKIWGATALVNVRFTSFVRDWFGFCTWGQIGNQEHNVGTINCGFMGPLQNLRPKAFYWPVSHCWQPGPLWTLGNVKTTWTKTWALFGTLMWSTNKSTQIWTYNWTKNRSTSRMLSSKKRPDCTQTSSWNIDTCAMLSSNEGVESKQLKLNHGLLCNSDLLSLAPILTAPSIKVWDTNLWLGQNPKMQL